MHARCLDMKGRREVKQTEALHKAISKLDDLPHKEYITLQKGKYHPTNKIA